MKKLIFIILLFSCFTIYSQEIKDTILYSTDTCSYIPDREQDLSFELDEDTLFIEGYIEANCCGHHLLIYEIYTDSIHLTRLDTGISCDCHCAIEIDVAIGNCPSSKYNAILTEYLGAFEIDTIIYAQGMNVNKMENNKKNVKCFPNPFSSETTVEFHNPKSDEFVFRLINHLGQTVRTVKPINQSRFTLQKGPLPEGFYIYTLSGSKGQYYAGKLIIQKK